jgi:hypothetical protein
LGEGCLVVTCLDLHRIFLAVPSSSAPLSTTCVVALLRPILLDLLLP